MMVKILATLFVLLALFLHGTTASAETHHVIGGENGLDLGSWLSGRVFRVGDKIWFNFGNEEKFVEVEGPDEFKTCDVSNPIRMYTDHVVLDKQGTRYFASVNLENCKKGLRIPISVESNEEHPAGFDPPFTPDPFDPPPQPWPVFPPPPPPPSKPSLAVNLKAFTYVFFVGLGLCCGVVL